MIGALRRQRARLAERLARQGRTHAFSLASWRLHRETLPLLEEHAAGRVLDAGSGRSPYRKALEARGMRVLSIDAEQRGPGADLIGDIQCMPEVDTASIDTILCTQVLEHVPRPWDAVGELARVLRTGGVLILSVPHLSAIHEAPHDYWRFTRYGLESLLAGRGFQVVELRPTGGLLCFLGHLASHAWLGLLGGVPLLRHGAWALNYLFLVRLLEPIDRVLGLASIFPCDYVALAVKRDA